MAPRFLVSKLFFDTGIKLSKNVVIAVSSNWSCHSSNPVLMWAVSKLQLMDSLKDLPFLQRVGHLQPVGLLVLLTKCHALRSLFLSSLMPSSDCFQHYLIWWFILVLTHVNLGSDCKKSQLIWESTVDEITFHILNIYICMKKLKNSHSRLLKREGIRILKICRISATKKV